MGLRSRIRLICEPRSRAGWVLLEQCTKDEGPLADAKADPEVNLIAERQTGELLTVVGMLDRRMLEQVPDVLAETDE